MKVGIVDYGVGNLGSIARALENLHVKPILINKAKDTQNVDRLILPGVGNFSDCALRLHQEGWSDAINEEVRCNSKPLLGICLGMQLLATNSTEGSIDVNNKPSNGLNLISGHVVHLKNLGCEFRIPHVGWNSIYIHLNSMAMFDGIPQETDYYFVHSYSFIPDDPTHISATTNYGSQLTAAVRYKHIWGTQFHPEKSSGAGLQLLKNFIDNPTC